MIKIFQIILLVIAICITACKKKETSEFTDTPIIKSYLVPGNYLNINITRQVPFSSDIQYSTDNINALTVNILYNNIKYKLTSLGNGNYIDSSLIVAEGKEYNLSFKFNNKNVTAYTIIPTKPQKFTESVNEITIQHMDSNSIPSFGGTMPDPVKLTWENTDDSYYIVIIENMETTLDPIRDFGDKTPPGNMFRKSPTNSSGTEIRSQEFQYYGKHRLILYHVLPDYASLYDEKSTTSQNLTNPSTSIVNGYGIFTGFNTDTLYIEVQK